MKRLFTIFLAVALMAIVSESGHSQILSHSVALHPIPKINTAANSFRPGSFNMNQSKSGAPYSPFIVLGPDTGLFYMDTTDASKFSANLAPSIIRIDTSTQSGIQKIAPDTIIGFGEHFTSPYAATKTYLDSVKFVFALTNIGAITNNYIRVLASKSRSNASGTAFPGAGFDSVDITNLNDLLSDPTAPTYFVETVPMHNKLVGSKEFFVNIETAFDPTQSILVADQMQNQLLIECDQQDFTTFNSKIQRGYGLGYLDGNPDNQNLVWAGITNMNHPTPYYSNFYIIAYISNAPSNGVGDNKLSGNALAQNYPNPFNPSTVISYSLEKSSKVSIKLYNALGLEVATILDANQPAGENQVSFSADNLLSGTYFYTMKAGTFTQTKRMVLAK